MRGGGAGFRPLAPWRRPQLALHTSHLTLPPPQLDIAYDGFVRTTAPGHEALVAEVLTRVWDKVRGAVSLGARLSGVILRWLRRVHQSTTRDLSTSTLFLTLPSSLLSYTQSGRHLQGRL